MSTQSKDISIFKNIIEFKKIVFSSNKRKLRTKKQRIIDIPIMFIANADVDAVANNLFKGIFFFLHKKTDRGNQVNQY